MANLESQKKRNRQNERRRERNKTIRTELKSRVRTARQGIEQDTPDAEEQVRVAQRRLAKAGRKGVVHHNQARRRISRLMRRAARTQA